MNTVLNSLEDWPNRDARSHGTLLVTETDFRKKFLLRKLAAKYQVLRLTTDIREATEEDWHAWKRTQQNLKHMTWSHVVTKAMRCAASLHKDEHGLTGMPLRAIVGCLLAKAIKNQIAQVTARRCLTGLCVASLNRTILEETIEELLDANLSIDDATMQWCTKRRTKYEDQIDDDKRELKKCSIVQLIAHP